MGHRSGKGLVKGALIRAEHVPCWGKLGHGFNPWSERSISLVHADPSEVLIGACGKAQTHCYISWLRRGEGMNIWHWTPRALNSCRRSSSAKT